MTPQIQGSGLWVLFLRLLDLASPLSALNPSNQSWGTDALFNAPGKGHSPNQELSMGCQG